MTICVRRSASTNWILRLRPPATTAKAGFPHLLVGEPGPRGSGLAEHLPGNGKAGRGNDSDGDEVVARHQEGTGAADQPGEDKGGKTAEDGDSHVVPKGESR